MNEFEGISGWPDGVGLNTKDLAYMRSRILNFDWGKGVI